MSQAPRSPHDSAPVWNLANALTAGRIVLVPVFAIALITGGGHDPAWRWIAALVFAIAAFTDHLDGRIARERGLITDVGKIADPIADKALTGAALLGLSALGDVAWWITIVIVVREVGITVLRFAVLRRGVIAASRGGKLKTVLLIAAILLYLQPLWFDIEPLRYLAWTVMMLALAAALLTGADYVIKAVRASRDRA